MTVGELKASLNEFPDDMEANVGMDGGLLILPIYSVVLDTDTTPFISLLCGGCSCHDCVG